MENKNNDKQVVKERSGWRDEWISNRHREFGWNCPFVDVDFMGFEFDNFQTVAIVEYKHYQANVKLESAQMKTLRNTADKLEVPFLVVVYYPEFCCYYVIAMNQIARNLPHCDKAQFWHEQNYVTLLYHIRGKKVPQDVMSKLQKTMVPVDFQQPKVTNF